MTEDEQPTSIEVLTTALQQFVQETSDVGPALVNQAVVVWERVRYDDDGEVLRHINYATLGDGISIVGAMGLLHAGLILVDRDSGMYDKDEDEE